MKRTVLSATFLALLLLAGCEGIEPDTRDVQITLVAYATPSTKGYVTGTVLSETDAASLYDVSPVTVHRDIHLSAYLYPQSGQESRTHYVGERFSYVPEEGWWSHKPALFWPLGSKMDFLAYSSGIPFSEGECAWRELNSADRVELAVSSAHTQDDILYASGFHQMNDESSVPLVFRHSQAWVELRLRKAADCGASIGIESVTLRDVCTAGDLTVTNNDGGARAEWDFRRAEHRDTAFDDVFSVVGGILTNENACMDMLLPEQEKRAVEVAFTVDGGPLQRSVYNPSHSFWLQGCRYIYEFEFSPDEMRITGDLEPWEDAYIDLSK